MSTSVYVNRWISCVRVTRNRKPK